MVSLILATYNSKKNDIFATLMSILKQKDIEFEIIVADDCSKNDYFDKIKLFFEELNFRKFKLVKNKQNIGTVSNVFNVIPYINYEFVKFISPGDYFIEENSLRDWCRAFEESGKTWTFCDIVPFKRHDGNVFLDDWAVFPCNRNVYIKNRKMAIRWNFLVIFDNIVGASIMAKRDYFVKYISLINKRVKFIEDTMYALYMYDGLTPYYYDKKVLFYNFNEGFSLKKSDINRQYINNDWTVVRTMIVNEHKESSLFQSFIWKYIDAYYLQQRKLTLPLRVAAKLFYIQYEKGINKQKSLQGSSKKHNYLSLLEKANQPIK